MIFSDWDRNDQTLWNTNGIPYTHPDGTNATLSHTLRDVCGAVVALGSESLLELLRELLNSLTANYIQLYSKKEM